MNAPIRAISRVLSPALLSIGCASAAMGDVLDKTEVALPLLLRANLPDPQAQLMNVIALLFAVSLSMMACGYVFDRENFAPSPSPEPATVRSNP